MSNENEKSIFKNLWTRRVPQFLLTYLGVNWGIIQFLLFATSRYGLDGRLVDKYILFMLAILPAVIIFTYNHGRPGRDRWTNFEKAFIPINLIIAGGLAYFISGVKAQNTSPDKVKITNEEGQETVRVIPNSKQVKKLAFFPMTADNSISEEENWLEFGIPYLLEHDLEQDMRLITRDPKSFQHDLAQNEYSLEDNIPLSIKLKVAEKSLSDYSVTSKLSKEADVYTVSVQLHEVSNGQVFFDETFSSNSIFKLSDKITAKIISNLFLKESSEHFDNYIDLPAADLVTSNLKALEYYIKSTQAYSLDGEYQKAYQLGQEAMKLDSKSPMIIAKFASYTRSLGDLETAKNLISEALKYSDKLPERTQFRIKTNYWNYNEKVDKVISLMENFRKLYPQDFEPYQSLLNIYTITRQLKKAKIVGKDAIKEGHRRRVLTKMADIALIEENFEEAEKYINEYRKEYPNLAKEDTRLPDIYLSKGDRQKALDYYDTMLLNDPQNGKIYSKIADINYANGEKQKAEANYEKALRLIELPEDSSEILFRKLLQHSRFGERDKLIDTGEKLLDCKRSYMPEIAVVSESFMTAGFYATCGAHDHLKAFYDKSASDNPQLSPVMDCITGYLFNLFRKDIAKFKQYFQGQCKDMVLKGSPDIEYLTNGFVASAEKNHKEAINQIEKFIEVSGSGASQFGYLLAEENRNLGKFDKAIELCEDYLKTNPYEPNFLFQLCLAQVAKLETDAAKDTYKKLEKLWGDAHPEFIFYKEYKELGKQLALNS